ncbi:MULTISPECIES: lactonase family protein [Emticicia]|uniref:lactonase family protein n=1 Tax=Emticicia TaxID=312278 RepID=UPI0007D89A08|nr:MULTISPECIES: lactonase family protein [Emticicia]
MKQIKLIILLLLCINQTFAQKKTLMFIGSYTDGKPNNGIYVYELNKKNGEIRLLSHGENLVNPSFLNVSPDGKYLYSCTETKLPQHGNISAFAINASNGSLKLINKQSANGENPVYVSIHQSQKFVISANYGEGNVTVLPINTDGSLNQFVQSFSFNGSSINKERQEKPHIHSGILSPNHDYLFLPDLGTDQIRVFQFDFNKNKPLIPREELTVKVSAGAGPRHLAFHPNKKFAYLIEEMAGNIVVYQYQNGKLTELQRTMANQKKADIYSSADIHPSPDGKFLYVTNRVENTIAIFKIKKNGQIELIGHESTHGGTPRNFNIDPTGNFVIVANQSSDNIVVFSRNQQTGLLKKLSDNTKILHPSCIQFKEYPTN